MAKRKKLERFSPFRVLEVDCLDLVAERLLDDLTSKPLESIRNFVSFSITTHWKPSRTLYMQVVRAFSAPGKGNPMRLVDRFAAQTSANAHRNACELAVSVIFKILQSLEPLNHPFEQIPLNLDEWKHAYVFFDQMRRNDFSVVPNVKNDINHMVLEATSLCAYAIGDQRSEILKHCRHVLMQALRLRSREDVSIHIQNNPFLISRCKCTVLLIKCPHLWSDHGEDVNPVLLEILDHDVNFLSSIDAHGTPTAHAIFIAGTSCKNTFEYVVRHPLFSCNVSTTLESNTIAHSLSTTAISTERLSNIPSIHTLFNCKYYMAVRLFELYRSNRALFCKVNHQNVQPWQHTSHLISKVIDKTADPNLDSDTRLSFEKATGMLTDVCCALRSCTL